MTISPVGLYNSTIAPPDGDRSQAGRRNQGLDFGQVLASRSAALASPLAEEPQVSDGVARQRLEQFVQRLRRVLNDAGVRDTENLTLASDGRGGILLEGEHPERETIEAALQKHPELAQEFNLVARDHHPADDLADVESLLAPRRLTLAIRGGQTHLDYL